MYRVLRNHISKDLGQRYFLTKQPRLSSIASETALSSSNAFQGTISPTSFFFFNFYKIRQKLPTF